MVNSIINAIEAKSHMPQERATFQDFGPDSVTYLRKTLDLPSTDGIRPC
jgi:hypothetical protein